jgi:hypothetical protein
VFRICGSFWDCSVVQNLIVRYVLCFVTDLILDKVGPAMTQSRCKFSFSWSSLVVWYSIVSGTIKMFKIDVQFVEDCCLALFHHVI